MMLLACRCMASLYQHTRRHFRTFGTQGAFLQNCSSSLLCSFRLRIERPPRMRFLPRILQDTSLLSKKCQLVRICCRIRHYLLHNSRRMLLFHHRCSRHRLCTSRTCTRCWHCTRSHLALSFRIHRLQGTKCCLCKLHICRCFPNKKRNRPCFPCWHSRNRLGTARSCKRRLLCRPYQPRLEGVHTCNRCTGCHHYRDTCVVKCQGE